MSEDEHLRGRGALWTARWSAVWLSAGVILATVSGHAQQPGDAPPATPSIQAPVLEHFVEAAYPAAALAERRAAEVTLRLTLSPEGTVTEAEVMEPAGHGFDEAARAAAARFRFKPASRDGVPVAARILYTYSFVPPPPPPPPEAPVAPALTDEPVMEVTVQGETAATKLRQSSRAVTVIETGEAQQESADLGAVLARAEGVTVQREGGLGSRARISLNGLTAEQVRVFLDGIPLELTGFPMGLANVPVEFVDRLEIYRGVVPIRFGADALGGAINLVSDEALEGTHARVAYQGGSFDTHRLALSGRTLHAPSGVFARARAFVDRARNDYPVSVKAPDESGREVDVVAHRFHDRYDAYGVSGELGLVDRPYADRLLLRGFYSDADQQVQHDARMKVPYGEVVFARRTAGANARYRHRLSARSDVEAALGYAYTETDFEDLGECRYDWFGRCVFPLPQPGEILHYAIDTSLYEHSPYARVQASFLPAVDHALRFTAAPTYVSRTGENRAVLDGQRDPLEAERRSFTGVAGVEYEATLLDGRLENTAFVKGYLLTVRTEEELPSGVVADVRRKRGLPGGGDSLRLRLTDALYVKGSYEYATRLPTARELFGDGGLTLPNFHLEPETGHNLNLSVSLEGQPIGFGELRVHVNGFARLVKNLIVLIGDTTFIHQNVRDARLLGVETSGGWTSPEDYLSLTGTFTFQDIRNVSGEGLFAMFDGERIPNRPYLFADGEARARWPAPFMADDALTLGYRIHWVHRFLFEWESLQTDDPIAIPTQLTHGLVAAYTVERDRRAFSASLEVQNLTDARVYDLYGMQRPGRAVYAKFALNL